MTITDIAGDLRARDPHDHLTAFIDGDRDDIADTLDYLHDVASAAEGGPWHWCGNTDVWNVYLASWRPGYGRMSVMGFDRWGMQSARPVFLRPEDIMLERGDDRARYEVCHAATSRQDDRVYRADIDGIRNPNATHMVTFDPQTSLALIHLARLGAATIRDRRSQAGGA